MLSEDQCEKIEFMLALVENHDCGNRVKGLVLSYIGKVIRNKPFDMLEFQADFRETAASEQQGS